MDFTEERRGNGYDGTLPLPPLSVDVTVWWQQLPPLHNRSSFWWFAVHPSIHPVRFRAIIIPFKHSGRMRVDLVYPLDSLPFNLGNVEIMGLHRELRVAVDRALPDWKVVAWEKGCIDLKEHNDVSV